MCVCLIIMYVQESVQIPIVSLIQKLRNEIAISILAETFTRVLSCFFPLSFYFSSNSQHHRESLGKKSVALMTCYSPLAWVYNGHLRADLPSQLGVGGEKINCLWCTLMTLHHNTVFIFTYYQKLVCFVQSPAANQFCLTSTRLPDHLHHPCPTFLTFILNNF